MQKSQENKSRYEISKTKVGRIGTSTIMLYSIWDTETETCICDFQGNEEGSNIKARQKARDKLKELNKNDTTKRTKQKCEKCKTELTTDNKQKCISWLSCKSCFKKFQEETKHNESLDSGVNLR